MSLRLFSWQLHCVLRPLDCGSWFCRCCGMMHILGDRLGILFWRYCSRMMLVRHDDSIRSLVMECDLHLSISLLSMMLLPIRWWGEVIWLVLIVRTCLVVVDSFVGWLFWDCDLLLFWGCLEPVVGQQTLDTGSHIASHILVYNSSICILSVLFFTRMTTTVLVVTVLKVYRILRVTV